MQKGMNSNHPKPGSRITVDPIRKLRDVKAIKAILASKPRDLALFTLGINTNLRASDLLRIKIGMVRDLEPGDELVLNEKKTGKERRITLNKTVITALHGYLNKIDSDDAATLFQSQRKHGQALTVPSVNRLVKQWCQTINLKGNYGSHSLRKTWGYHQRVTHKVDIPILMECFNHSSQKQTLTYLGIQPEEIKSVYENEL
ncbi:tyrosine-type recombinase/integrase [Pseudodesulfovibrio sp.]|uniref:tyrosine-type recombinase/integrase n=1 Tax=unclassified Pseudodesulfovibrio TaxID=2661612 RepID=UPI003AFF826D